jgi:hypothetical protein
LLRGFVKGIEMFGHGVCCGHHIHYLWWGTQASQASVDRIKQTVTWRECTARWEMGRTKARTVSFPYVLAI